MWIGLKIGCVVNVSGLLVSIVNGMVNVIIDVVFLVLVVDVFFVEIC